MTDLSITPPAQVAPASSPPAASQAREVPASPQASVPLVSLLEQALSRPVTYRVLCFLAAVAVLLLFLVFVHVQFGNALPHLGTGAGGGAGGGFGASW